jgi:hypothetical protein
MTPVSEPILLQDIAKRAEIGLPEIASPEVAVVTSYTDFGVGLSTRSTTMPDPVSEPIEGEGERVSEDFAGYRDPPARGGFDDRPDLPGHLSPCSEGVVMRTINPDWPNGKGCAVEAEICPKCDGEGCAP